MKRRDPELELVRFRRSFARRRWWLAAGEAVLSSAVAAALGFAMVLALGVVLYGPPSETRAGWYSIEQAER